VSLKENVDMIKDELSQEEKLFASAVKTERFVKKYKSPLIGAIVAIVVVVSANTLYQAKVDGEIERSNEAYAALLKTPSDEKMMSQLEENNKALYEAWLLQQAMQTGNADSLKSLEKSSSQVITDLATYQLAAMNKDKEALNAYALNQNAILKDLAIFNEAVLLMQEGKNEQAHERLKLIDEKSALYKMVTMLRHYGVK
jgi:hypothetical protein